MSKIVAGVASLVLLLSAAGCGGLSKDETTAAARIGKSFAGPSPTAARTKVGNCFGTTLVTEAGLDQLKKDKVIDDGLTAARTVPRPLSTKTAEAYGDGIVKCFDYDALGADIAKRTGASKAQVTAYVTCMDKISHDDVKQAVVDQYTQSGKQTEQTAAMRKFSAETTACGKKLGS